MTNRMLTFLKNKNVALPIGIIAVAGLVFQIGHFYEHTAQMAMWFVQKDKSLLYMSPWVLDWAWSLGEWARDYSKTLINLTGVEILHLIGNTIFLIGITAYRYFDNSRSARIAWWIQAFHVFEHILLTTTAMVLGQPLGFSTLFGLHMSAVLSVSYRAWFHFFLNLIPSVYVGKALWEFFRKS